MQAVLRSGTAACQRSWKRRRPRRHARSLLARAEQADAAQAAPDLPGCPRSAEAQVQQASAAVRKALEAGVTRQRIELELPTLYASDLDDWPGGVRQQAQVLLPMLEQVLRKTVDGAPGVRLLEELDDGDAVTLHGCGEARAVAVPTADVLSELRDIDKASGANLMLLANPQWSTAGQVISDFGIGPWRKRNEAFVATFEPTYCLQRLRIKGEQVQLLKCYPTPGWQVFVVPPEGGVAERVAVLEERPPYNDLDVLLTSREGSLASMDWVTRARAELDFNTKSMLETRDLGK